MYYKIFIIYYSLDSPSSLITESVCLVGKGRLKERCGLEPGNNYFSFDVLLNVHVSIFILGIIQLVTQNFV